MLKSVKINPNKIFLMVSYIDIQTNQHVIYIPALEISGYGDRKPKAEEMVKFMIKDYEKKPPIKDGLLADPSALDLNTGPPASDLF